MLVDRITPTRIRLEASSACQLRCPSCPTTTGDAAAVVGKGWLKFGDFRQLLDANPQLREIELSNYGEIFVNPELEAILEYAHARGVALFCDNGANLNDVSDAVLQALVKYGLRSMLCSIDGASQAVYESYRVRGTLATVLANIRRINALKQLNGSPYPALAWQFIVFPHNEHELPAARAMAAELGMEFRAKLRWDRDVREQYREQHGVDYMAGICTQLWLEPQVNWDGKVLGCCRNFWGEFGGNAFGDGLEAAVNGEKMRYARRMLQGAEPARADIPCTTCDLYRHRQQRQYWIKVTG
ncbi:MAG: SPASM domain-containing protein [Burkholderiales bacterium]|nr:SPASM domain-containing protein [Burkholderiales bacterium]